MKTKAFLLLCAAALAVACDPGYSEDVVVRNSSTHTVTIIPSPNVYYNDLRDSTFVTQQESHTIAPGQSATVKCISGLGGASRGEGEYLMQSYLNDSVVLLFDSAVRIVYHAGDTGSLSPYNFQSDCYTYEQQLNSDSWTFKNNPRYGKLTFTVGDAHFEAAESAR